MHFEFLLQQAASRVWIQALIWNQTPAPHSLSFNYVLPACELMPSGIRGVINFKQTPQFPWLGAQGKFKENQVTWDWAWRQKICWSQLVPKKLQNILATISAVFVMQSLLEFTWFLELNWQVNRINSRSRQVTYNNTTNENDLQSHSSPQD